MHFPGACPPFYIYRYILGTCLNMIIIGANTCFDKKKLENDFAKESKMLS